MNDEEQAFEREIDENRRRLTRSDLDAVAKRRAQERITAIRAELAAKRTQRETQP